MNKTTAGIPAIAAVFLISALLSFCSSNVKGQAKTSANIFDAAAGGNTDFIVSYVKNGNDVDVKNRDGVTALMLAAYFGRTEALKLLIDAKADINGSDNVCGETALMMAASKGRTEAVKLLLSSKADINARDGRGWTALMHAKHGGHDDIVDLLDNAGAR